MINVTRIQLIGGATGFLDVDDKTTIPLNLAVADIKDISKKTGVFSKSITLPGTKNNHKILNNYYDVNIVSGEFDINKRQKCDIIQNGIVVLSNATIQLVSVNKEQHATMYEDKITYTVLVKDSTADFFTSISNKYLEDINMSGLNHIYTAANVISSFTNTVDDGYKYVMPYTPSNEYSLEEFTPGIYAKHYFDKIFAGATNSNGVGYSYNWPTLSDSRIRFDKLIIPYNGDVVSIENPGDCVNFTFINGSSGTTQVTYINCDGLTNYISSNTPGEEINFCGKRIVSYTQDSGTPPYVNGYCNIYSTKVERVGITSSVTDKIRNFPNTFLNHWGNVKTIVGSSDASTGNAVISIPTVIYDPSSDYNSTLSSYVAPNLPSAQNDITFNYTVEYELWIDNTSSNIAYFRGYEYTTNYNWSTAPYASTTTKRLHIKPQIELRQNNNVIFTDNLCDNIQNNTTIRLDNGTLLGSIPAHSSYKITSGTTSISNTKQSINPNDVFNLTSVLTLDTDLSFNSVTYNFYKVMDPLANTGVPPYYNGLYDSIDNCKFRMVIKNITMTIQSNLVGNYGYNSHINMNNFVPKKIKQSDFIKSIFTMYNLYVEVDKDNPNQLNISTRDDYYDAGQIVDWSKKLVKEKGQELKFLPEVTNKKLILTYKADDNSEANTLYTKSTNEIYGQAEYTFDNEYVKDTTRTELIFSPSPICNTSFGAVAPMWNGQAPQTNIRILYDGGEWTCNEYTIYDYGSVGTTCSVYPLISHYDKPYYPTFDINFLPCDYYYYYDTPVLGTASLGFSTNPYGALTNNNLFNLHWRRTMNQINTGKILTAYFVLKSNDIAQLRLNAKVRIDNSWWNINKISDYDANGTGATKVELVSIDDSLVIPYKLRTPQVLNRNSPKFSVLNKLTEGLQRTRNQILTDSNIQVNGRGNFIGTDADGVIVTGDFNTVTSPGVVKGNNNTLSSTGIIVGNNNSIDSGLENVNIFSNNVTATQSDTLYLTNIVIPGTINGVTASNTIGLWEQGSSTGAIQSSIGNNISSGAYSFTVGQFSVASGNNSFSLGYQNTSSGFYSGSIGGITNTALGGASTVAGLNNTAGTYAEVVIGSYGDLISGNNSSLIADDPIFRVGIGTGTSNRLDGFRVYKNGAIKLAPVLTSSITTPVVGMMIWNSNNKIQVYDGTQWVGFIKEPIQTTGVVIRFDMEALIYNTPASPGTGNITSPVTAGILGTIQKIYHQQGTAPTFPSSWVLLRGAYSTTALNIIYAEWVDTTRVEYWIIN